MDILGMRPRQHSIVVVFSQCVKTKPHVNTHHDSGSSRHMIAYRSIIITTVILILATGLSACTVTNKAGDTSTEQSTVGDDIIDTVDALSGTGAVKTKFETDKDLAIAKAKELWRARSLSGDDLSAGPCLTNAAVPGWVADIVHNPRTAVDDIAQNQCSAYRDGTASHVVELDVSGNLVRAE